MAQPDSFDGFGQIFISDNHTRTNEIEPLPENEVMATPYYNRDGFTGTMVKGIAYPAYTTTVYNIEVEDYHTYFAGRTGILVHNTNCGKTKMD
ncbi:intein C-terminal splicing region [Moraxella lacunata]|uniref:Intein C-terminal splicing region n=1 Tax=Moraxella lacunata TaxID=477 RepID=A0A378QJH6_MORLA|nr:intein C-terminal splicing region [Moraxella lacunata]